MLLHGIRTLAKMLLSDLVIRGGGAYKDVKPVSEQDRSTLLRLKQRVISGVKQF